MKVDISIIIVNYNVRHFIKRTIESVYASKVEGVIYDIHVVDNASIDGSVDMICSSFPDVHLIANKDNVGFSTANNQAIRLAKGDYVLILNPDTVLQEDTLQICYDYMIKNQDVGAVGVKMIDGAGNFLPESKRDLPTVWNSLAKLSGLAGIFPQSRMFNGYALGHLDKDKIHSVKVLCGAFMFVSKLAIDKVGMFDERFFMYGEDIDWSRRIIEGGFEIHYVPNTTIIHFKGESTKKASLNYVKTFYGAMGLYVEKHYSGGVGKWFSRFLKLGIGLRAGVSGLKRILMTILWPLIDAGLIGAALFGFSKVWASQYFGDPSYYDKSNLEWNIVFYALIWAFVLWFVGYYQKSKWQKRLVGVLSGLGTILVLYALLPIEYRSSRVIILAGTLISFIVTSISSLLSNRNTDSDSHKNILIVAEKKVADEILKSLEKANIKLNMLGVVNPMPGAEKNLDYLNDISQLKPLSKVLKADEIIFSSDNMSMKEIMKQMVHLDTRLSYKIAGDDSLSILGSNSKNTTGELYNVNIKYHLADGYFQHIKRIFDFSLGLILLVISPVLIVVNRFQFGALFKNLIQVIFGVKTLVGYRGYKEDFQNLPVISDSIIEISAEGENHTSNMHYARDYSVWKDLEILLKNLNKLA
ncbi:MAG: GT2 family glycosyltransferase [Saprospiraceae bacterium]|jgi:GT2 family glycosyltransferase